MCARHLADPSIASIAQGLVHIPREKNSCAETLYKEGVCSQAVELYVRHTTAARNESRFRFQFWSRAWSWSRSGMEFAEESPKGTDSNFLTLSANNAELISKRKATTAANIRS